MADTIAPTPKRESESPDAARLVKRYERLAGESGTVRVMQQELAEYFVPYKSNITIKRTEGEDQTQKVWTSVGIEANELLASSIQGSLMSQAIRWFSLKLRNQKDASKVVTDWLEQCEERIYQALRQSNFNAEASELCIDLGAFGIGALFVEERPRVVVQTGEQAENTFGGFRFLALAPSEYEFAEDYEGRVDTLFRCYKMAAVAMEQAFGRAALPEPVSRVLVDRPDQEFEVIHAVYPRRVDNPKRLDAQHKPWASCYLDRRTKTLLSEGGYDEFPYMVPRWRKTSGEKTGRGPGHTALPAIRVLSRATELGLSALSKALDPPGLFNADMVFGELEIRAASMNPVDGDPRQAWVAMESGAKFDVGQMFDQKYEQQIQHIFYWDQLQLQGDKLMTATEVERRLELMRRVLGPTLGRFESELLNPLISRCFGLMLRAGALPEVPEELKRTGSDLDIEYEGPLARSQKATRVAGFEQLMATMLPVSQHQLAAGDPNNVFDNNDWDAIYRDQLVIVGGPSEYLKDSALRDQERAAKAQAAAQQAKLAQANELAKGLGSAAPMLKELVGAAGMTNGTNGTAA